MLPRGQVVVVVVLVLLICYLAGYLITILLLPQPSKRDPFSMFMARPRVLQVTFDYDNLSHQMVSVRNMNMGVAVPIPIYNHQLVKKYNPLPNLREVEQLDAASSLDDGECIHMHEWQAGNHPTCNTVHEMSSFFNAQPFMVIRTTTTTTTNKHNHTQTTNNHTVVENGRLVNNGGYRDIFMIREFDGTKRVLKTLRTSDDNEDFDLRNADRHRRDAVAMDELQKSNLIVKIFGYCTNSGLFRFSAQGSLDGIFEQEPNISKHKLLKLAYNASLSISHAHHYDQEGRATIAHTDIKYDQFLYEDGYYKLMDFNRNRFLRWNNQENQQCTFKIPGAPGRWRSPEEYLHKGMTEKVDVYSLGNVLYFLLTRNVPFSELKSRNVSKRVRNGERPHIEKEIRYSRHPFDEYMISAIHMCFTADPNQRPSAKQVANKLAEGIAKLSSYNSADAVPDADGHADGGQHPIDPARPLWHKIPPKPKKPGNEVHHVEHDAYK
jgi:hypothetical protein